MGIINVTPDSFSGDGIYHNVEEATERAEMMVEQGALLLDVGGESTRPGFVSVDLQEELARVIPAVRAIVRVATVPVSVDTRSSAVAERALAEGAQLINDTSGLSDCGMATLAAREGSGLVCIYNGGIPSDTDTGRFLVQALSDVVRRAEHAGMSRASVILDPGLGFGKRWRENFAVIRSLDALAAEGLPVLVGPSRKGMISRVLGEESGTLEGSLALAAMCVANGAAIIRAHDVGHTVKMVRMIDALTRPDPFPWDSNRPS